MNKCIGCGETLQYEDINKIGYAVKGSDICKRCFDLTHYNKNIELKKKLEEKFELLNKEKEELSAQTREYKNHKENLENN